MTAGDDKLAGRAPASPLARCSWASGAPVLIAYHDEEWGVPVHDDRALFESLTLGGAQAGLSWLTVLKRRPGYRTAFRSFDPALVAALSASHLVGDSGIIRHRGKIESAIANARRFLEVQHEFGSFDAYVWRFVDGSPIRRPRAVLADVPATTPESDALSRDLRQRGFSYAGSTICYAFMQGCGLVDDHLETCFRHTPAT